VSKKQLLPQDSNGIRLWETFGNYAWAWIHKHPDADAWTTEKRYPLRPRVMWKHWRDAETLIGVRFGKQTAYAMLDIDKGSDYLNETSVRDIFGALETIGITRPVVLRSSWSGGLHIYLPLPEPVGTFDLAVALKGTLEAQGFKVAEGQLECFPNTKTFGKHWLKQFVEYQGHRLPLQPGSGSTLLASYNLQPIGGELDRFWSHWDFAAQAVDMEMLRCAIAAGKANRRKHKRVWSKLHQWRSDLEHEISEGWTANGQTNQLLKAIATFGRVFVGLAGDDLAAYVSDTARDRPGFHLYCRHQHEIHRKALCWARSVEGYYHPCRQDAQGGKDRNATYPLQPAPDGNKARMWDAVRRITEARNELLHLGWAWLDKTPSDWAQAIVRLARCSMRTLYKYRSEWHPESGEMGEILRYIRDPDTPDWWSQGHDSKTSVKPQPVKDFATFEAQNPGVNPYTQNQRKPLLLNPFTNLGGGMKSSTADGAPLKKLIPQVLGGCGGKEGFPQAFEGV
jgi:hypothetical protein